jgi:hypothetical protein
MGMSTSVRAFIPDTDETFQKHKKVLIACREAGISLPKESVDYFGYDETGDWVLEKKLEISLGKETLKEWSDNSSQGFEINIADLPKGVTKLRFANYW